MNRRQELVLTGAGLLSLVLAVLVMLAAVQR
jgi:hypothetical protein